MAFKAQGETYSFSDSFTIRNYFLFKLLQYFCGLHGTVTLNLHDLQTGYGTTALSQFMNDPWEVQCRIALAAPLHDIGKLGVSDTILMKPGMLSPEERALVETHTVYGFDLLKNLKLDQAFRVSPLVIEHHERLDGSGYPFRLKDISAEGRKIALIDSFEAMTGARPYRKAFSFEGALERLKVDTFTKGQYGREEYQALEELVNSRDIFHSEYPQLNPTVYRSAADHYDEYSTEVLQLIMSELEKVIPATELNRVRRSAFYMQAHGQALARELRLSKDDIELLQISSVMSWLSSLPYKNSDLDDDAVGSKINREIFRILELIGSSSLFEEIGQILVHKYYYYKESYNEIIRLPKVEVSEQVKRISGIIQVIMGADGLDPNEAIAVLDEHTGTKFDPDEAQAMIRVLKNSDYEETAAEQIPMDLQKQEA